MRIYKPAEVEGTTEYSGLVKFIIQDSPDLEVGDFIIREGDAFGPETEKKDKVYFVMDGRLCVTQTKTGEKYIVEKGDMLLIGAGQEHCSATAGEMDTFVLWFRGA